MRRRPLAFLALALMVTVPVVILLTGSRTTQLAFMAAVFVLFAAINIWLWARCRSWPEVAAVLESGDPANGRAEPHLVYTYAEGTYARPAQTPGTPGCIVPLKVNPTDPSRSSLVIPRPDGWIAVLALASCVLVGTVVRALAA